MDGTQSGSCCASVTVRCSKEKTVPTLICFPQSGKKGHQDVHCESFKPELTTLDDGKTRNNIGVFDAYSAGTVTIRNCDLTGAIGWADGRSNSGTGTNAYGGFIGYLAGGSVTIENCTNTADMENGDVTIGAYVGVIAGGTCTIKNSISDPAGLVGGSRVGGFIGQVFGTSAVTFENCVNNATIYMNNQYSAGFIANTKGSCTIAMTDCVNNGDIYVDTTRKHSGKYDANGGFIGLGHSTGNCTLTNCVNNGDIDISTTVDNTVTLHGSYQSGIIGNANFGSPAAVKLTNCVNNGAISGGSSAAGILNCSGWNPCIEIKGCTNNGTITVGDSDVGGLVGRCSVNPSNGGALTISQSNNYGAVNGVKLNTGGLVGLCGGGVELKDSHNYGEVSSTVVNNKKDANGETKTTPVYSKTGGLVGGFDSGYDYENKVTNCNNYASVTGNAWVGGLIGTNSWSTYTTVLNCANYGDVTGWGNTGGIVGMLRGTGVNGGSTITNCVNYGSIYTTDGNGGGIVGETSQSSSKKISNCINIGPVDCNSQSFGGIVGYQGVPNFVIENCATIGTLKSKGIWRFGGIAGGANLAYTINNCHVYSDVSGISYLTGEANNSGVFYGQGSTVTTDGKCTYFAPTVDIRVHDGFNASVVDVATATAKLNAIGVLTFVADADDTDSDGKQFEVITPTLPAVQETSVIGGTFDVRFIAGIDAYHIYNRVGFYVMIDGGEVYSDYAKCQYVYTDIKATVGDTVETFTAADFYSDYIYALTVTDVPATGTHTFMIAAVAETGGTDWQSEGSTNYQGTVYLVTYTDGQFVSCVQR